MAFVGVPNQRLGLVHMSQLQTRERVYYDYQGLTMNEKGIWRYAIFDGDYVIPVKEFYNSDHCVPAAEFNAAEAGRFRAGDHIYTHPRSYKRLVTHHGLCNGQGYVYHFDQSDRETDELYEKCEECRARGQDRREALSRRGLGCSGIRKSCLYCFSQGRPISVVKYDASYLSRLFREAGTRSTRHSLEPAVAVRCARKLYEDNSFGKYSIGHNCEAFAFFCKTLQYDSKQVTRVLLGSMFFICQFPIVVAAVSFKMYLNWRGQRKIKSATAMAPIANQADLELVPAGLGNATREWLQRRRSY